MPTTSKANKSYITKRPRHVALLEQTLARQPQPNKYKAVKTYCTARHLHDSGKESRRCEELMLLEKSGEIRNLTQQPVYVLVVKPMLHLGGVVSDEAKKVGKFTADFQYFDARTDVLVVEDSKGFRKGEAYRLRKRLFEALYGVEVFES